ncbi:hypothetical protein QJS04_geneDACA014368 [Acorus gramineus]|uniref:Uncharacterized protein n=1 Tax=Acorus gramineus TaxID=55184 RepID=A0AAV9A043_ACOGR|nr:hypothetical protein QJS04_geneDACA014368 [Acorus gramineus]
MKLLMKRDNMGKEVCFHGAYEYEHLSRLSRGVSPWRWRCLRMRNLRGILKSWDKRLGLDKPAEEKV